MGRLLSTSRQRARGALLVSAAVLAIVAVASCGVPGGSGSGSTRPDGDGEPTETSAPAPSAPWDSSLEQRLQGRAFETAGPGDVRGFDLVPGSTLTISFDHDPDGNPIIGANAGCNSLGGPVAWEGDTIRPVDGFFRTEMACEGLMDQEDWFFDVLNGGVTLALESDFVRATIGDTEIIFTDSSVLHPDVSVGSTTWRLDGIVTRDMTSSVPGNLPATLTISRDPLDGHLMMDIFDGLTWMSVPGGFDAASGEYSGSVTIEPTRYDDAATAGDAPADDPLAATAGTVRVTGGLAADGIGCAADAPDCRVAEMALLGSDFEFSVHQDTLTVTGLGEYSGQGLMFVIDPTAPTPDHSIALAERDNPLLGRTFELTRTFTDAGGANYKHPDASLTLTFGASSVTADGSCGAFTYDDVRYIADPTHLDRLASISLGSPSIPGCVIGDDPPMPPMGGLMYGSEVDTVTSSVTADESDDGNPQDGAEIWLSTGFVMWFFRAVP